jgi:hypothetical protein
MAGLEFLEQLNQRLRVVRLIEAVDDPKHRRLLAWAKHQILKDRRPHVHGLQLIDQSVALLTPLKQLLAKGTGLYAELQGNTRKHVLDAQLSLVIRVEEVVAARHVGVVLIQRANNETGQDRLAYAGEALEPEEGAAAVGDAVLLLLERVSVKDPAAGAVYNPVLEDVKVRLGV